MASELAGYPEKRDRAPVRGALPWRSESPVVYFDAGSSVPVSGAFFPALIFL